MCGKLVLSIGYRNTPESLDSTGRTQVTPSSITPYTPLMGWRASAYHKLHRARISHLSCLSTPVHSRKTSASLSQRARPVRLPGTDLLAPRAFRHMFILVGCNMRMRGLPRSLCPVRWVGWACYHLRLATRAEHKCLLQKGQLQFRKSYPYKHTRSTELTILLH